MRVLKSPNLATTVLGPGSTTDQILNCEPFLLRRDHLILRITFCHLFYSLLVNRFVLFTEKPILYNKIKWLSQNLTFPARRKQWGDQHKTDKWLTTMKWNAQCLLSEALTWVDDSLRLCSWFQAGTADRPSSNICPVHHPLPAVVVNSHNYGALCGPDHTIRIRILEFHPSSKFMHGCSEQPCPETLQGAVQSG